MQCHGAGEQSGEGPRLRTLAPAGLCRRGEGAAVIEGDGAVSLVSAKRLVPICSATQPLRGRAVISAGGPVWTMRPAPITTI